MPTIRATRNSGGRGPVSWLLGAAGTVAAGYVTLCVLLFLMQRGLMYHPDGEPLAAELAGPNWRLIKTQTEDGLSLSHLYLPGEFERPTLLLLQGNAGHAGHRSAKFDFLAGHGVGLLLAGYRGFGGNPGAPHEAGLYADARSLVAWLQETGVPPGEIVLYGESLGSGVASRIAAELAEAGTPVRGLILEAPFTSMAEAAQAHYPFVPAQWLVRDRYDSLGRIARIAAPLLILHGEADRTVPFAHGQRLYEAAMEPKRFVALPDLGHAGHFDRPEAVAAVRDFVIGAE